MALTPLIRASLARVRSIINFPTEEVRVSGGSVRAVTEAAVDICVTMGVVRAIVKGRVDSPKIRVWTFTLDNHDFYVMRLGGLDKTVVYDTLSKQWAIWGSGESLLWRGLTGCNWQGGRRLRPDQSDVVVGDDGIGALYFLSPDDNTDDDAIAGSDTPRAFRRRLTAQVVVSDYTVQPCFGVQLYGSIGAGEAGLSVQLEYSDDRGQTYTDAGSITLTGDYTARVHWQSLGSMVAPGRLFRVTNDGALKRIDRLEMDDPDGAE